MNTTFEKWFQKKLSSINGTESLRQLMHDAYMLGYQEALKKSIPIVEHATKSESEKKLRRLFKVYKA
jgi:hypothetical protein